jgi:hypothetical protein
LVQLIFSIILQHHTKCGTIQDRRNAQGTSAKKPEGKNWLGKSRTEGDIEINLQNIRFGGLNGINLAQNDKCRAAVKKVTI